MPTQRQIEANRLNALKSTGPRTPEGKARSSMNALKSGLDAESQFVYGEAPEDFAALQQQYLDEFQPATPQERLYVDTLIRNEWLLRRLFRAESQLWEFHLTSKGIDGGYALGEVLDKASPTFMRLQRRVTLCERSYNAPIRKPSRSWSASKPLARQVRNPKNRKAKPRNRLRSSTPPYRTIPSPRRPTHSPLRSLIPRPPSPAPNPSAPRPRHSVS